MQSRPCKLNENVEAFDRSRRFAQVSSCHAKPSGCNESDSVAMDGAHVPSANDTLIERGLPCPRARIPV